MLRCNEVTRLYASEALRSATWRKRIAVRLHLLMCRSCQRYVKELRLIGDEMRRSAEDSPEEAHRIESLVQRVLPRSPGADR